MFVNVVDREDDVQLHNDEAKAIDEKEFLKKHDAKFKAWLKDKHSAGKNVYSAWVHELQGSS